MRRIIDTFRNLSLGIKVTAAAAGILISILLIAIALLNFGVKDLSNQTGHQRIEDEVRIIQSRIVEAEQDTLANAKLIASTPGLAEAVAAQDTAQLRILALTSSSALNIDDIDIVNAEGVRYLEIADETVNAENEDHEAEDQLFARALLGIETTGFISTTGEKPEIMIAATVPLRDAEGTIVGGLIVGREIDDEFLEEIDFARRGVHLLLIYEGEVIAQYTAEEETTGGEIDQDSASYETIVAGDSTENADASQTNISEELVRAHGETYAQAYTPLSDDYGEARVAILVNMDEFFRFQNQLTRDLILALALIGSIALIGMAFLIQRSVSTPLGKLQAVAEKMSLGNYWQRAPVRSKDEIGRLAV